MSLSRRTPRNVYLPGRPSRSVVSHAAAAGAAMVAAKLGYGSKAAVAAKAARVAYRAAKIASSRSKSGRMRSKRRSKPTVKKVARKIQKLEKRVEADTGTYIYRESLKAQTLITGTNHVGYHTMNYATKSLIEGSIDALPVWNPSTSAFVNANFTSGNSQKEIEVASTQASIILRNNYQSDVKVTLYQCVPRVDTSIDPKTAMTNGFTDNGIGASGVNNPLCYPSDSEEFKDLWMIKQAKTRVLKPGQAIRMQCSHGSYQYDPSFADDHNLSYQVKGFRSGAFLYRLEGTLGHDSAAAGEVGYLDCGVDAVMIRTFMIKYPAGADIKRYECTDGLTGTYTNGPVQSQKPVADNIAYSVG